jgi:hypothetical protein
MPHRTIRRGKPGGDSEFPSHLRSGEYRSNIDSSPSDGCLAAPDESLRTQHGGAVTGMRGPRRIKTPLTTLGTGLAGPLLKIPSVDHGKM